MKNEDLHELADLPTHRWGVQQLRAREIAKYLAEPRPTTAQADQAAGRLNLSRRSFYRLVAKAKSTPKQRSEGRRGAHAKMDDRVRAIVDSEVAANWPGFNLTHLHARCTARCVASGLRPPSLTSIRRRLKPPAAPFDLARALGCDQEYLLDGCPLNVDLQASKAGPGMAVLWALLRGSDAVLLAYGLSAGPPEGATADKIRAAIEEFEISPARLAAAPSVRPIVSKAVGRIRAGEALIARYGAAIGRLTFLPHRATCHSTGFGQPVTPQSVHAILEQYLNP